MEFGEGWHVEVAGAVAPFLMLLGGQRANEAQATRFIGEDADDQRAALKFLMESSTLFEHALR